MVNICIKLVNFLLPIVVLTITFSCEGGTRSLSVFDNDIGSGSVSPLILTGGSGGDVGLHDFRYIATGRTKRHRHTDNGERSISPSSSSDMRAGVGKNVGDQNRNGMLWYIPKAHLGTDMFFM